MAKTTDEKYDLFSDKLNDFFESLPDDDKTWVAVSLCREIILNITDTHMEELGFVEVLKDDLKEFFHFCREEEKKEAVEK